jgi:tRNA dimethylallyltransferase
MNDLKPNHPHSSSKSDSAGKQVWIIAGPTASGKSALAVEIAERNNGVVINADSMQIYQEIPVISAQPPAEERKNIPHLLYGFRSVTEHFSAADWATRAATEIDNAFAHNKQPILVGGSGLYLQALTDGFSPMPEVPPNLRHQIGDLYDMLGPGGFHDALKKIDPVIAARLHPTDRQRCIRAREIFEVSNEPLSAWQSKPKKKIAPHLHFRSLVLLPDREWLHERINRRFEMMVENGALDEAIVINNLYCDQTRTGLRAVGLPALRDHVDGRITLNGAIEQGKTLTRQYAKRQYTWFRGQPLPETFIVENLEPATIDAAEKHLQRQ